jgi:EpsI family protein
MRAEKLGTMALGASVLAVGALAWWLQTRPELVVDPSPLASLPRYVGDWRSVDLPLESTVESVLRADFNIQRAYLPDRDPKADPVWIYVGYYGTERGGRPEHVPRGCYTGAGWDIAAARVIGADDGTERRVNEYLVERGAQRHLVHFWYRSSRRSGMVGGVDQNVDRILGRLSTGRADGALIRLSTPLHEGAEDEARARLLAFGSRLDRQLAEHWPAEHAR